MKTEGVDEAGLPVQDYQIKQFEDIIKAQEQSNLFKKALTERSIRARLLTFGPVPTIRSGRSHLSRSTRR